MAAVSVRGSDFIDVLERVLTRGIVFEIEEDPDASAKNRSASGSFQISIVGINVFKMEAGVLWRYLLDDEEEGDY
jgi:hypothetical protein